MRETRRRMIRKGDKENIDMKERDKKERDKYCTVGVRDTEQRNKKRRRRRK
jgi:hypothetical protein